MTHTYIEFGDCKLWWQPMHCWNIAYAAGLEKYGKKSKWEEAEEIFGKHSRREDRHLTNLYNDYQELFEKYNFKREDLKLARPDFLIDKGDRTALAVINCVYDKRPRKPLLRKILNHTLLYKPILSVIFTQGSSGINDTDINFISSKLADTTLIQSSNFNITTDASSKDKCIQQVKEIIERLDLI